MLSTWEVTSRIRVSLCQHVEKIWLAGGGGVGVKTEASCGASEVVSLSFLHYLD